jgi:serine/threonine protein kinase
MLTPNTVLQNRYRIIRQLGQGGMGTVYEAEALRLSTTVALKETHFTDEPLRKQFEREAQLLAGLRHPALPRVIDHFDEGDGLFLVMDFIRGEDLWEMLQHRSSAFLPDEVLKWADQLLDTLSYLHYHIPPVIHRDIKPQNLKLSESGQIILLDFGLAKGFAGILSRATTSGSIFGYTPNYAPLEQIQGTGTDPRSDLYALAATLYHLMTGQVPPDVLTRLAATTDGQADPLRSASEVNSLVTLDIAVVLDRAMAIGRSQRFANATEMRDAFEDSFKTFKVLGKREGKTDILLPSTIVSPDPIEKEREQEAESLQPTVSKTYVSQDSQELNSTVATPTAASYESNNETPTSKEHEMVESVKENQPDTSKANRDLILDREGQKAFDDGNYELAIRKWEEAQIIAPLISRKSSMWHAGLKLKEQRLVSNETPIANNQINDGTENHEFRYHMETQRDSEDKFKSFYVKLTEIEGFTSIHTERSPSGLRFTDLIFSQEINPLRLENIATELGINLVLRPKRVS